MRIWLLWIMNLFTVFYSIYLLILHWGFLGLMIVFLGPLTAIVAPLLVWLVLDNPLFILLFTLGNIVGFAVLIIPSMIDEALPLNKTVSWIRFIVVSTFAIVAISQGIAFIGLLVTAIFNEGSPGLLGYLFSTYGGIMGGYYLIAFNEETRFEDLVSKKMLYSIAIPLNVIMIAGNVDILGLYALNSIVCLVSSILFITNSEFS
jgi:hypothetical protein